MPFSDVAGIAVPPVGSAIVIWSGASKRCIWLPFEFHIIVTSMIEPADSKPCSVAIDGGSGTTRRTRKSLFGWV